MSDFLSINPAPDSIMINGKKVDVHGISMEGLGHLVTRFPNLINDINERMQKDGGLKMASVVEVAGPATGAILAAGFGHPGNEEAERMAGQLGFAMQTEALDKICEKTMPDGFGPFVERWGALLGRFAPAPPRKPRFKVLPNTSNVSSESLDIPSSKSGA